ncbi:hypothetical protein FOL47_010359 [Perkinsus chesapeaki]|uniref:C3H1-type domain-containing protein n=1 Tax=Perkinsus chesapeaki TaxID=330153 RepID=A0A7J6N215_PERCH|nr:hypothetical protein FOL47_010359 [Perkinsus chesapeaki]
MPVQPSKLQTKLPGLGGHAGAGINYNHSDEGLSSAPSSPESRTPSSQEGKAGGRNREVFSKTRMCKFYLRGQCKHGSDCGYAHDWSELRQAPDLRKTKMCQLYRKGQCPNGADCAYAHSRDELRATADVYKTSLCRFWMNGSCNAGSKCRHAHGAHELRTRVPTAAGTDAILTASTTNRLAEAAVANDDPDLMATAASLAATQKASLGSTMAMNDYLEQANLLEQIAKTLEQINETTGSSGFTAGDEVTLRLRSYTGGRDMVAALLDDPPANAPSVTNALPTVPVPKFDAEAPVFVPRKSISSITNEQLQQLQAIIEEGSFNVPSAAEATPLTGPADLPPPTPAAEPRARGMSGWKPYESSNVNSRRLSQIATILEAKRRLSSFSLAPPGLAAVTVAGSICAVYYRGRKHRRRAVEEERLARIDKLIVYPVKSAAGINVDSCELTRKGLKYDRIYCIVVPSNDKDKEIIGDYRVLTQRSVPRMSQIYPSLPTRDGMSLSFREVNGQSPHSTIHVPLSSCGKEISFKIWSDEVKGIDQGDAVADWLGKYLQVPGARLVKSMNDNEFLRCPPAKEGATQIEGLDYQGGLLVSPVPSLAFL